jgi:uncharacterized membrane protein
MIQIIITLLFIGSLVGSLYCDHIYHLYHLKDRKFERSVYIKASIWLLLCTVLFAVLTIIAWQFPFYVF